MADVARMRTIVLDCPDPHTLARFYGVLLGREVTCANDEPVSIPVPGGKLSFQLAPATWHRPGPSRRCRSSSTSR